VELCTEAASLPSQASDQKSARGIFW